MAGFEAWRAGEAQSTRPRAPHPSGRPHSCTCWGKPLNGNNVKFHSYLMSSDLTGPRGKDRSKTIVLDKFLKAAKSNRQTLQKLRLRNEKKENPLIKLLLVARPAQRQPEPWALARLFVYVFICLSTALHKTSGVAGFLSNTHRDQVPPQQSKNLGGKSLLWGKETGGNNYSEIFNQFEQLFLMLKENETG